MSTKMFGSVPIRESSSLESLGVVGKPPVGLKLEVSPDILPRDTSIGSKIFTLVPADARNVREVKTHLANFVLKTPVPFHLFVGEYRIRDEEDVQIFSVIHEPCRLLPVPKPRPALSSTPKVKLSNSSSGGSNTSGKRVTFFDGDLSASPVERCEGLGGNGMSVDQLDHPFGLPFGQAIQSSSRQCLVTPIQQTPSGNGDSNAIVKMYPDRKRRRRHRSKKSKSGSGSGGHHKQESDEDNVNSEPADTDDTEANGSYISEEGNGTSSSSTSASVRQQDLAVLNEETESEEESANSNNAAKDDDQFDFITPCAVVKAAKRLSKTDTPQIKRQKFSDSAFSSPGGSFLSPSPVSSGDSSTSSGKVRQDTPIPRVIRNPKFFDTARKIINEFSNGDRNESNGKILDGGSGAGDNLIKDSNNATGQHPQMVLENDSYYLLDSIKSLEEVNLQDKIAFRVLELDERYNPCVSDFKEGIITGKVGAELTIEFTKNDAVMRNGKYEFQFDEGDNPATDTNIGVLKFSEMLEPKFIHRSLQG